MMHGHEKSEPRHSSNEAGEQSEGKPHRGRPSPRGGRSGSLGWQPKAGDRDRVTQRTRTWTQARLVRQQRAGAIHATSPAVTNPRRASRIVEKPHDGFCCGACDETHVPDRYRRCENSSRWSGLCGCGVTVRDVGARSRNECGASACSRHSPATDRRHWCAMASMQGPQELGWGIGRTYASRRAGQPATPAALQPAVEIVATGPDVQPS